MTVVIITAIKRWKYALGDLKWAPKEKRRGEEAILLPSTGYEVTIENWR